MKKTLAVGAVVIIAGVVLVALVTMRDVEERAGPVPLHHVGINLSFEERARYHYEIEKARHFFRTGSAKRPFDEAYPHGTFEKKVEERMARSRLLIQRFGVRLSEEDLQGELDRMKRNSRRPDILKAMMDACHNDPAVMRQIIAEPALVDRKLEEIFKAKQEADPSLRSLSFDEWVRDELAASSR